MILPLDYTIQIILDQHHLLKIPENWRDIEEATMAMDLTGPGNLEVNGYYTLKVKIVMQGSLRLVC